MPLLKAGVGPGSGLAGIRGGGRAALFSPCVGRASAWCLSVLLAIGTPAVAAVEARPGLTACRLPDVEHDAWCGSLRRALDPSRPQGLQIEVYFAVLPALARHPRPDPVFFLAGGPGQSAIELAGPMSRVLGRLGTRRDLVFIDQRGTGRSAPLQCAEGATRSLAELADPLLQRARMQDCRRALQQLPYGDLRQFTTTVAMGDVDAVRRVLGAEQVNLVGGSYGTRAALEYLRQFPQAVRRLVIDGVAPADMALPIASSRDNQAALDGLLRACEIDAACSRRYPGLRGQWQGLLSSLPRAVQVAQPVSGVVEHVTFTREMVLGLVRAPLYAPALASVLPFALSEAALGRFEPLVGLGAAMEGGRPGRIAEGMHFSVVCAEDLPAGAAPDLASGADFGTVFERRYREICADWPRGEVPAAFRRIAPWPGAALVLSGGADPATPPRHGERVARALGAKARHLVVPQAGHGLLGIGCIRDLVFRFIDAPHDDVALGLDLGCATRVPRPTFFMPLVAEDSK
jgi:pimeloyl-ACP methyl ester carboxylesterase